MDKEELKQIYASIHTLRVEGDDSFVSVTSLLSNFNPHPPHGG